MSFREFFTKRQRKLTAREGARAYFATFSLIEISRNFMAGRGQVETVGTNCFTPHSVVVCLS